MERYRWLVILPLMAALGCLSVGTDPGDFDAADVTILFVGNSLTYTHDVPGLVRALADQDGRSVSVVMAAAPNYALEDHWNGGIADDIRRLQPDIVVMQQGPSSLPENREHLVFWSRQLATVIREVGGEPALYMVWPDASRHFAFSAVEESYAAAAEAVDGTLLPAGTTWLRAWDADENFPLYGGDGFHPSYLGALAAAQTIYAALFAVDPAEIPWLGDNLSDADHAILRSAVAASLEQWAR